MENRFNESLTFVLQEMCNRVGADFNSIDFSDEQWYNKYEWTIQECKQYKEWLSDYLYNNAKARRELSSCSLKKRYYTDRLANEFVFMYGWKYCEKE